MAHESAGKNQIKDHGGEMRSHLKNGRAEESLRKTKIKRDYDFSRDAYKRCSAEIFTSAVQLRWLDALFSRDGYKHCSAEMITSVVEQRWLQALFSRDG